MRIRITIDTEDAVDYPRHPFTLFAYRDDDDGTASQFPLLLGSESALIDGNIPTQLRALADLWEAGAVTDQNDEPVSAEFTPEED